MYGVVEISIEINQLSPVSPGPNLLCEHCKNHHYISALSSKYRLLAALLTELNSSRHQQVAAVSSYSLM